MGQSQNLVRTGRVSSINYQAGTFEVTYTDWGQSVTGTVNAVSNGEYKMPGIGQVVSVLHNGTGTAAAVSFGSIWNRTNAPAEGYKGLYRKEYGSKAGQAYERYDENTGAYSQHTDKRTGRVCNGDILDDAKGSAVFSADGQVQIISRESGAGIQAKAGIGLNARENIALSAEKGVSLESGTGFNINVGGETHQYHADKVEMILEKGLEADIKGADVKITVNGVIIAISRDGNVEISGVKRMDISAEEFNVDAKSGTLKGVSLI